MNEAQKQVGTMSQTCKAAMQQRAHLRNGRWRGIPQPLLDVAMAILFWVKFGRMRGQPLHSHFGVGSQKGGGHFASVNRCGIPHQDEPGRQVTQHMAQGSNDLGTAHDLGKLARVDVARQGQADAHGQGRPGIGHTPQNRALALWGPRGGRGLAQRKPELIKRHDIYAVPPRLFLSWASRVPATPGSKLHPAPLHALKGPAGSSSVYAASEVGSGYDR
jgi:hypothetical protein